jgi:hypothetical protein
MFPDPSGGKYLNGGFKREKASVEKPGKASRQASRQRAADTENPGNKS